ncbi:hypothetical protein F511_20063 [Dorcoceras hygrometricum]|uniref:Uncharacterized protein n=1 Tax=Dorcoceras hygrometricum TaxID=472368 RepID=A0A2Z7DA42_9LAMI|nr:hypothetical protein F511_20063 [Dorcoceras hygrometricum]
MAVFGLLGDVVALCESCPKRMSTRVNVPVARGGNVVVLLSRLDVQLREIFATVACCWLRLVPAERSVMRCFVLATRYPAAGSEDFISYATSFEALFNRELFREFSSFPVVVLLVQGNPGSTAGRGFNPAGGAPGGG